MKKEDKIKKNYYWVFEILIFGVLSAFVINLAFSNYSEKGSQYEAADKENDRKEREYNRQKAEVRRLNEGKDTIQDFVSSWQSKGQSSANSANKIINDLAISHGIAVRSEAQRQGSMLFGEGEIAIDIIEKSSVSGPYKSIIKFINAIQDKLPNAPMGQLEIKYERSDTVSASFQVVYPSIPELNRSEN